MDLSKMVFVTGFARGGTTWLRNSIATHPRIGRIGKELVLFRDHAEDRAAIEQRLDEVATEKELDPDLDFYAEKSPANAPFVDRACRTLPEARFVFIVRDPRDVFISHKRGTRKWMGGVNSTVKGCMEKTQTYYEGYERAADAPNVLLVRYEDLHQDYKETMRRVFEFVGVEVTPEILDHCYEQNDFWKVATRHLERRDEPMRKGVVGDWVNFLEKKEGDWFRKSRYWSRFMEHHGYAWDPTTYERILHAMSEAGVRALSEDEMLDAAIDRERPNVLLCHDIDSLRTRYAEASILALAEVQAKLGMAALYFFLPLDDTRYAGVKPETIAAFARRLQEVNPKLTIGLHLNAAERFFPADAPEVGEDDPLVKEAVAYLHEQIDAWGELGFTFRTATAHGYGRRKKLPNNRDAPIFTAELKSRGIALWDTVLRPRLFEAATAVTHFADVGGAIAARDMPTKGAIIDAETYRAFEPGSVVHVLIHPGNYDTRLPMTLGRRTNTKAARAVGV